MEKVTGADFKSATADDNKKLFIETYGCQMNVADSEVITSRTPVKFPVLRLPRMILCDFAALRSSIIFPPNLRTDVLFTLY